MVLARWQATVVDDEGNILTAANVEVRREIAGAPIAVIYSDRDGLTPKANPFAVEPDGFAAFHALGGAYRITATSGTFSRTWRYVPIGLGAETDGRGVGIEFSFNTDTTDADPGSGFLKFNNATLASVTKLFISDDALNDSDISPWIDSWDDGGSSADRGTVMIQSIEGVNFLLARVTGSVVNDSGYRDVTVSPIASNGTFAADQSVYVTFSVNGADGEDGADGDVAGPGATVVDGQVTLFASGTGSTIKGLFSSDSPLEPILGNELLRAAEATDAEVQAATPGRKALMADHLETAALAEALVDAATVAVDWKGAINFTLTVTASRIIGNPTGGIPGTHRTIMVQGNDATDRAITFGNQFLGEVPVITDCDSARWYLISIYCHTASHFIASAKRAFG